MEDSVFHYLIVSKTLSSHFLSVVCFFRINDTFFHFLRYNMFFFFFSLLNSTPIAGLSPAIKPLKDIFPNTGSSLKGNL